MLLLAVILYAFWGCTGDHSHDEQDHAHSNKLEPLVYTLYSEHTELFVEFMPLVAGEEVRFAAHFTRLGETFTAIGEGEVELSLLFEEGLQSATAGPSNIPGIFRLQLKPEKTGSVKLLFEIKTSDFTDQITIEDLEVYPDEEAAFFDHESHAHANGEEIPFLKEQSWKIDFATQSILCRPFSEIIKTSGQLLCAPGDEMVLIAQISGIVSYARTDLALGVAIPAGGTLFTIRSYENVRSDLSTAVKKAEEELETARPQVERASELAVDQIISEREFLEAKLRYENAQAQLAAVSVSRNFNINQAKVTASRSGFLKNIWVENGQFVEAGQPLATLAQINKLLLHTDVSQKYFSKLDAIESANFKTTDADQLYNTRELNGRVLSYGRHVESHSPFVPLILEIDNPGDLIPGSVVETYLLASETSALVVPESALLEEQGLFYVFVQIDGEHFQKREVKLGASNGLQVEVLSGLIEGERVVTKGAYQVKLSAAMGQIPAHSHSH